MAILRATNPTLLDIATRLDPDGRIATAVELLEETNEILPDMTWIEGNLPTGHKTTIRTGLPEIFFRRFYEGVAQDKSTTAQITDNTAMLRAYAEVDKELVELNGNSAAFRMSEEVAWIEAINQKVARSIFFGEEGTEPEAFTGLTPRFNDLSAENADNIIDAGGTGSDNGSIWMVVWGPQTCHGIYPKGSTAGLSIEDKGVVTLEDASNGANSGRMEAYRTYYKWDLGLTVRDWRYVVRIANIDKSELSTTFTNGAFTSGANLPQLMFRAMRLVPQMRRGRPAFYMSRDMATRVAEQSVAIGNNSFLQSTQLGGDEAFTERFHGVPLRRVDVLSADEARVV